MTFFGLSFAYPWALLLLALLPLLAHRLGGPGRPSSVRYSSASLLRGVGRATRFGPGRAMWLLRLLTLGLIIIAAARPRLERGENPDHRFGIDVALVCDISGSMETKDYQSNGKPISRYDALINAIDEFLKARPKDRSALIGFAGSVYLLAPLTTDGSWLPEALRSIKLQGGTAIGEGIYTGIDVLEKSKAKSRVMIVVSDGFNNTGRPPAEAAEAAAKKGIRVHTLQVMSFGELARSKEGTQVMEDVAKKSGGLFFPASSAQALQKIYRDIDRLEKQRIEAKQFRLYDEIFIWPLSAALLLALLELAAGSTFWIRLP